MNLDTDASTFAALLLGEARRSSIEQNPFIRSVCAAIYPRNALRVYGTRMFELADQFPPLLHTLVAGCSAPELREHLEENLREEEGCILDGQRGWIKDPGRKHSALIMKFVRAVDPGWSPNPRPRETWVTRALQQGRSLGVLAYLMVGLEANVPRTFRLLIPAFRDHYGFSDEDLTFFIEHLTADEQHGDEGARILSELATTRQERSELIDGANKGAAAWWWFHRSCDRAIRGHVDAR